MPRLTRRYHGPAYIIGMDRQDSTTSLLHQLRQVAQNAAVADKKAGVPSGPKVKHTQTAFRKALDGMREN